MHCNAIRISGFYIERVVKASEMALKQGLTVWFSPSLQYDNQETTFKYIIESAAAEDLRGNFPCLIFVAGCELSLFTIGFVKGATGDERIKNLFAPISLIKNIIGVKRRYNSRLNTFLLTAVTEIKKQFNGQITYASGTWEKIEWEMFDMIGIDHYRSSYNRSIYLKELQHYKRFDKPLCVTEFGCCTYKGAMGWAIVDWKKDKPELKGNYIRIEEVQAKYLLELLNIFDSEKVEVWRLAEFVEENSITFYLGNLKPYLVGIVKVITHYGEFTSYNVKHFTTLFGKDIIIAHRLLKNDIEQHEYWLVTKNVLQDSSPADLRQWMQWSSGTQQIESGEVAFHYTQLSELKNDISPDPPPQPELSEKVKMISQTREYETDLITLFHATGDFNYRSRWQEGVKKSRGDQSFSPAWGMRYRSVMESGEVTTYASSYFYQPDKIEFSETDEKKKTSTYFTLEKIDDHKTRLTLDFYLKKNIISQIEFKLTKKKLPIQIGDVSRGNFTRDR